MLKTIDDPPHQALKVIPHYDSFGLAYKHTLFNKVSTILANKSLQIDPN